MPLPPEYAAAIVEIAAEGMGPDGTLSDEAQAQIDAVIAQAKEAEGAASPGK